MMQWLKSVSSSLCILTIVLHLVPEGKFAKYVRFYAGLLFFLMTSEPVVELFVGNGELERLIKLEFLKEDYGNLETSMIGMEELKNNSISKACQQEIQRQVKELASVYGLGFAEIQVDFEEEDIYRIKQVSIICQEKEQQKLDEFCRELSGVYMLDQNMIRILNR